MGKNKISCLRVPIVPGTNEESKMYVELTGLVKNRPLANYVYASYLLNGVNTKMDALGYKRNTQGQHKASDVYAFFEVSNMKSLLSVNKQSEAVGFTDSSGNLIDFEAEDAYTKAQDFNNNNTGRVAYVSQNSDKFNIIIQDKNSRTQKSEYDINKALTQWNELKEKLRDKGINLDTLYKLNPSLINPGTIEQFLSNLKNFRLIANDTMAIKDIELLLSLEKNSPIITNVISRGWGNTENALAQKLYDILHDSNSTPTTKALANKVIDSIKSLPTINVSTLIHSIESITTMLELKDDSFHIQKILEDLDKKYKIETQTIVQKSQDIVSYSDALGAAIMSLTRQIRTLENKSGKTAQSETLSVLKRQLMEELEQKKNVSGLVNFLNTAVSYLTKINAILSNTPTTGTALDQAFALAAATAQANNLNDAYFEIVSALATGDLFNDLNIATSDLQTLKSLAQSTLFEFQNQRKKVKELQKVAMTNIGIEFIGTNNALYSKDLSDILDMVDSDTSITDYLYSIGRCSNVVMSMLGAIIRDAQERRDFELNKTAIEINRINHLLIKDGKNSSFMYDKEGRIVSEYDWKAFHKAESEYKNQLIRAGFKKGTLDFEAEMDLWRDKNTVDLVVDKQSGRTEKVPNDFFRLTTDFQEGWSAAQKEYYTKMLDLKGRIGTLLPHYAQHQYLAPQKRTSWDQVLKETIKGERDFMSAFNWFKERAKIWKIQEDDERFRKSGIHTDEGDFLVTLSGYDDAILKQIPIFHVKKIDSGNLSHDFSSAMQSLASTTLNYKEMDEIKNIAELMTDYVNDHSPVEMDESGRIKADISSSKALNYVKLLRKKNSNVATMMNSFVMYHIYGHINESEGWRSALLANLIGYTSLRGLGTNALGAATNKVVGIVQTLIEAFAGQYYNLGDWLKAEAILLGEQGASTLGLMTGGLIGTLVGGPIGLSAGIGLAAGTAIGAKGMMGKFIDIVTGNKNSKDTLISDFFDSCQSNYKDLSNKRYHSTVFGRLFGSFDPLNMYGRGEYWIHMLNVYAVLQHEKVVKSNPITGKKEVISIYDALKKGDKIDGNSELQIDNDIFTINGIPINTLSSDYFKALKRRIRYINQQCHGSMNKEDVGIIRQYMLGKLVLNFRQWMIEHYSRRFRTLHWDESIRDVDLSNFYTHTKVLLGRQKVNLIDALAMIDNGLGDGSFHYEIKVNAKTLEGKALTDEILNKMLETYAQDSGWRRGFKTDVVKLLVDYVKEYKEYGTSTAAYWDNLSETQKANAKRVMSEAFMILALLGLDMCMGDPNKHKGEWYYKVWQYVIKRVLFDELATTPVGVVLEGDKILNSLIPSSKTAEGLLYPIMGILNGDVGDTLKSGEYKGWNKYGRNVLKYTVPFWPQIDQLMHIDENEDIINNIGYQITR